MSRVANALWQRLQPLGAAGIAGCGLLLFAALYFLAAALPERERMLVLERETAAAVDTAAPEQAAGREVETDLAAFYAYFARAESVTTVLAALDAAVAGSSLAFDSGEYRMAREGALRLARYEVTLPLNGSYTQLRGVVATLLDTLPQAALEDIAVKRTAATGGALEARLRLSIYLPQP